MMQQKIVIKLKLRCDNCRSKAMKIATVADGVITVAWEGDGTDAATVTRRLRKNLGYADLKVHSGECSECRLWSYRAEHFAVEDHFWGYLPSFRWLRLSITTMLWPWKQKIVIKVQVRCDKCRSKAMKIAAVEDG
ncbi:hypothetical protein QYF36_004957 [Acer negundo]|nr:hypothetical protein QYF36_004957 [Acer negundo]